MSSPTLNVMIVEDHPHMRAIYRPLVRALLKADFIHEARDGIHALEVLRAHSVDLAMIDLNLPDFNGIELIHMIRHASDSVRPTLPILVISADATSKTVQSVRDSGANAFLAKPFSPKALQAALTKVINDDRPFVRIGGYFGPDRRRKRVGNYNGPDRRGAPEHECADMEPSKQAEWAV